MAGTPVDRPLLTAGVTAFNAEASIERAVFSALEQSWRPLEVVVVDDHSSDATPEILAVLEASHPEVRVIRHATNRGTAGARNTLLREARGVAIAFFDDDDASHPDRICRQWEALTAHEAEVGRPTMALCHTGVRVRYPGGGVSEHRALGSSPSGAVTDADRLVRWLVWGYRLRRQDRGVTGTCTQLARLSTYQELGGFDEAFRRVEDSELNIRLARRGGHLIGVADCLVEREMAPAADRTLQAELFAHLQMFRKHRDAFRTPAMYVAALRWTEARFAARAGCWRLVARMLWRGFLAHPVYMFRRIAAFVLGNREFRSSRRGLRMVYRSS